VKKGVKMTITREEYAGRLTQIRQAMADRGLDALLVYSWKRGQARYVSGYAPNYIANVAMVVIPPRQDPTLFIRFPFDLERARAMCWFDDVRASGDVDAVGQGTVARLRELQLDRGRIGLVGGDGVMDELPCTLYQQLRGELPEATFSDARGLTMDIRLIKSPAEFALLQQSARVADAAVTASEETVAPGVNEYAVVSAAEAAARAAGAEDYLVAVASRGTQQLIGPPGDRTIEREAVVIIEVAVQVGGYWTQVARTFVVGDPTAGQRAIYKAVHRAYSAAVDATYPGKTLGAVGQAAYAVLGAAGYADTVEHDIGHGIGLDLPEPPSVELGAKLPIQEGMVVVLHPSVRVHSVGGAFVGGTVLITKDGPVTIHEIPEELT
jgi:Xaa-Pro dipeptidase